MPDNLGYPYDYLVNQKLRNHGTSKSVSAVFLHLTCKWTAIAHRNFPFLACKTTKAAFQRGGFITLQYEFNYGSRSPHKVDISGLGSTSVDERQGSESAAWNPKGNVASLSWFWLLILSEPVAHWAREGEEDCQLALCPPYTVSSFQPGLPPIHIYF